MKHRATKLFGLFAMAITLLTLSCTEYTSIDYTEVEQEIFDAWMAKYHPDLLPNYQEDGGYYIDIVTVGDTSSRALSDTICWIQYDLTGYDLYGNVCLTRNDVVAWQQGTFTEYTHYTPYYRLSDADNEDVLLECTQLAFTNELTIGDQTDVLLYNGAEFTLYSPSSIASSTGTTGTGGYEGQYTLSTLPFICKIKVVNMIINPLEYDQMLVDAFAMTNGGLTVNPDSYNIYDDDEDEDDDDDDDDEEEEEEEEDDDPNAWTNATSNLGFLYLNKNYELNLKGVSFNYINPYTSTVPTSPYVNGMAALDKEISEALEERFIEDYDSDGELVGDEGTATVWYICRLLDGFIVDTNIDEVKEIIYGSVDSTGSAITYDVEEDESSYISGWFYSIPYMRYGQWSAVVMTSTYAYGSEGVNGDTTTTSSSYYDYYNYYNYYNSYYSSYYSSSYYNYNYYDSSYYYDYDYDSSDTSTSISTEILPYTSLLFQIYIEAEDE
ncbi:MAG: hypothetical protein SNH73_02600 [Rikenellaceae bacterium]